MPAIHAGVSEEMLEELEDNMVEGGQYEDVNDAVRFCVEYTLHNKYNVEF